MIIDSPVISGSLAASFRNVAITGSLGVTGSITTTGTITAQTLVVQTVTSSVDFITGSAKFGTLSSNTFQFTGSVLVSGSATFNGQFSDPVTFNGPGSNWAAVIQNTNSTAGTSYGLRLKAGTSTGADATLVLQDYAGNEYLTARGNGRISIGGTNSPATTLHVSGSSEALGRVARFNTSYNSASINIAHSNNGGNIGFANIGSGDLSNVFFVSTGVGTIGSGIVVNNSGGTGFATSNVTESIQATGTISIIPNSSVSSGPLVQFAGNGRIRPASSGDRLSIDGNALYLNSFVGGHIITNTAGGGFSIGRSDVPSTFNISGSTSGGTPIVDIRASGTGAFLRGVRMLNPDMTNPSSLMYAVGYADGPRNMGQFYFYFVGNGSTGNRLSMGLHSVDDVFNIFGSGNVVIGQTSDPGYKLALNGQPGANGYTAWTNYSDIRLKENITDLDATNVLSKISSLRPVTFNYNELSGYDEETRSRRISGFVAQELKEVFPEMVGTINMNGVEYYDTNTSNLQLYLVKAIQEQQTLITSLQSQIDELKNK